MSGMPFTRYSRILNRGLFRFVTKLGAAGLSLAMHEQQIVLSRECQEQGP
jgi:hypothetical protein